MTHFERVYLDRDSNLALIEQGSEHKPLDLMFALKLRV